jgi:hypothetical protein
VGGGRELNGEVFVVAELSLYSLHLEAGARPLKVANPEKDRPVMRGSPAPPQLEDLQNARPARPTCQRRGTA